MVHITKSKFDATPVALPPLNEQRRIVAAIEEHLSRLDAADASLAAASARNAPLRQTALSSAFLGNAPMVGLGEVASVVRGVTYKKEQASSVPEDGFVPILRATNIQGHLNFDELVYVPEAVVRPEQRLRPGDVVLAASSGSAAVVGKSTAQRALEWLVGAFCAVSCARIRRAYVAAFVSSPVVRRRWSDLATGTHDQQPEARAHHRHACSAPAARGAAADRGGSRGKAVQDRRSPCIYRACAATLEGAARRDPRARLPRRARPAGPVRRARGGPPRPHPRVSNGVSGSDKIEERKRNSLLR